MSTPYHDAESTPSDLLSHVEIEVGCNTCQTSYSVPGALIRDSQRILAAGCTGTSLFECDASYYATLIEPEVIANLERAWASFQQSATSHGGIGVALVGSETNEETTQAIAPETRALQRWENEGGRCDQSQASVAPRRKARQGAKGQTQVDQARPSDTRIRSKEEQRVRRKLIKLARPIPG